jgi:hypothetical protein
VVLRVRIIWEYILFRKVFKLSTVISISKRKYAIDNIFLKIAYDKNLILYNNIP